MPAGPQGGTIADVCIMKKRLFFLSFKRRKTIHCGPPSCGLLLGSPDYSPCWRDHWQWFVGYSDGPVNSQPFVVVVLELTTTLTWPSWCQGCLWSDVASEGELDTSPMAMTRERLQGSDGDWLAERIRCVGGLLHLTLGNGSLISCQQGWEPIACW